MIGKLMVWYILRRYGHRCLFPQVSTSVVSRDISSCFKLTHLKTSLFFCHDHLDILVCPFVISKLTSMCTPGIPISRATPGFQMPQLRSNQTLKYPLPLLPDPAPVKTRPNLV